MKTGLQCVTLSIISFKSFIEIFIECICPDLSHILNRTTKKPSFSIFVTLSKHIYNTYTLSLTGFIIVGRLLILTKKYILNWNNAIIKVKINLKKKPIKNRQKTVTCISIFIFTQYKNQKFSFEKTFKFIDEFKNKNFFIKNKILRGICDRIFR